MFLAIFIPTSSFLSSNRPIFFSKALSINFSQSKFLFPNHTNGGEIMFKFAIAILLIAHSANAINGRCRALVLGGGTDRGAFQAGAISGLISNLPYGEAQWDVVVGNGVGALNGLFVAVAPIGEELALNQTIYNWWISFKRKMIYKPWFGGKIVGYYKKTGLFNSAPLKETIGSIFDGNFDRFYAVGVTDLVSAKYFIANNTLGNELLLSAIEASFDDDGTFPFVPYKTYQFVSGDLVYPVDLASGINACIHLGYSARNIYVDTVMVTEAKLPAYTVPGKSALQNGIRALTIRKYQRVFLKIKNTHDDFPHVNFRTLIPLDAGTDVDTSYPYSYSGKKELEKEFRMGYNAAVKSLSS